MALHDFNDGLNAHLVYFDVETTYDKRDIIKQYSIQSQKRDWSYITAVFLKPRMSKFADFRKWKNTAF